MPALAPGLSLPLLSRRRRGPALDLNYEQRRALLGPETFTRSSTGWYFNSAGVLVSAASDVARFAYDPSTLTSLGLRVEESRANRFTAPAALSDASWLTSNASKTSGQADPAGGTAAIKLLEAAVTNGTHGLAISGGNITAGVQQVVSFIVKAAERTWCRIVLADSTSPTVGHQAWFNLGTGAVGTQSAAAGSPTTTGAGIKSLGGGWYLCWVTATLGTSTTTGVRLNTADQDNNGSYAGDAAKGIYAYQGEINNGSFPTSPILTGSATRAADACSIALSSVGIPSAPTGLTWLIKGRTAPATGTCYFGSLHDGSTNNELRWLWSSAGTLILTVVAGGVQVANVSCGTLNPNTDFKAWATVTAGGVAAAIVGGSTGTGTPGSMPTGLTTKQIGARSGNAGLWNSTIARDVTFNRALSQAEAAARAAAL